MNTPTVGRIVHFTVSDIRGTKVDEAGNFPLLPLPAVVTRVLTFEELGWLADRVEHPFHLEARRLVAEAKQRGDAPTVIELEVFPGSARDLLRRAGTAVDGAGGYFVKAVPFSETPTPGCWSWPPRVGA